MSILILVIVLFFIASLALVFVKPSIATGIVFGFAAGLMVVLVLVRAFFFILSGGR